MAESADILTFLREVVGLIDGVPSAVLQIHTFGFSPEKYHPHLHVLAIDGLFRDTGTFYMMKDLDLLLENIDLELGWIRPGFQ